MERNDIEKFLKEKKGYDDSDIAEFWEGYLIVDPNFEYTEWELDAFAFGKGLNLDYRDVDNLLKEVGKSELFSDEKMDVILDDLEEAYPGYKDWYYEKINSWSAGADDQTQSL